MLLIALALLAAAPEGKIVGKVTIAGLAPKLANLPVTRDMKFCGTSKPDEALEVGTGGGVKNAVVWVTDVPLPKKPPVAKFKLDQQACSFAPHVLAAPLGATVDVINSDSVLHNARAQAGEVKLFNYAMPIKGHTVPTKLRKEGFFKVSCDVHPWMHGWLGVMPTEAFAVSDADGNFVIAGVPAGHHKVKLWHERLGERDAEVDVAEGGAATLDFTMNPR